MRKGILILFLLILTLLNSSNGQSGHCHAILNSRGPGQVVTFTDPQTESQLQKLAGLINGSIDGNPTQFYSNEYQRVLHTPDGSYFDSSSASDPKIVYILNYYFPLVTEPSGKLNDVNNEAAATQLALWHFSNCVNANTITNSEIKLRALTIISDANLNSGNIFVPYTLDILPDVEPEFFVVQTTDNSGNGISVNNIELYLTQTSGKLSTNCVNTVDGLSPPVEVINSSIGLLTAIGNCIIPPGIMFSSQSHNRQALLLAKPTLGRKSISYDWGTLPVEMSSFTYSVNINNVKLNWTTISEINNSGFYIERRVQNTGTIINEQWLKVGFVRGNGTTDVSHNYSYTDYGLQTGYYFYRLRQIDLNGNFEHFDLRSEVEIGAPEKYSLAQNYPNPFNPNTVICYQLPVSTFASVKIFNATGKEVRMLVNEKQNAGRYEIGFNASGLSSGIYFYKLETETFSEVKKMILVK